MSGALVAAALGSGCPHREVVAFVAPALPACVITPASSPPATRTLDVGAADAYRSFAHIETAPDDDVAFVSASVAMTLQFEDEEVRDLFSAASAQARVDDVECDDLVCIFTEPYETGVETSTLIVDDERRLALATFDAIPAAAVAHLESLSEKAQDITGATEKNLDSVADLSITFSTNDGSTLAPVVLPVGVCLGCLAPSDERCEDLDASAVDVGDTCLPGQDDKTRECRCDSGVEASPFGCLR